MLNTIMFLLLIAFISPTTPTSPPSTGSLPPTNNQQQPVILKPNRINKNPSSHFRPAVESDLPALTTIIVEAFSPSGTWNYLMPDQAHHKKEIWSCMHDQLVQGWKQFNREKTFLNVITVPLGEDSHNDHDEEEKEEREEETPVALAFWNMRSQQDASSSLPFAESPFTTNTFYSLLRTCSTVPGTNLTRAHDFDRQMQPVFQKYFFTDYPQQLYLNLLATHPDWDGNGFAARHVRWGMELSRGRDGKMEIGGQGVGEAKTIPVTLLSSPAGWPVYEELGFEGVENATVAMLDGLGKLWFEVSKWDG